jgi:hypothetical protein
VTKQALVEGFRELSTDDKLEVRSRLWDEIAPELERRPASPEERELLEERLREIDRDARPDRAWEDVRRELLPGK